MIKQERTIRVDLFRKAYPEFSEGLTDEDCRGIIREMRIAKKQMDSIIKAQVYQKNSPIWTVEDAYYASQK
jgi:hypothetical protein